MLFLYSLQAERGAFRDTDGGREIVLLTFGFIITFAEISC